MWRGDNKEIVLFSASLTQGKVESAKSINWKHVRIKLKLFCKLQPLQRKDGGVTGRVRKTMVAW